MRGRSGGEVARETTAAARLDQVVGASTSSQAMPPAHRARYLHRARGPFDLL